MVVSLELLGPSLGGTIAAMYSEDGGKVSRCKVLVL